MKQFVCFMSPSNKGYKTYNKFHNYHMKRKFISDSSYHMLKPQTNRKLRFYRIFLPILLRETRIGDVIHRLGLLNFSKYVSALCHNLIYEIEIFHSINRKTWVIFFSHVLHLLSEISLFHKFIYDIAPGSFFIGWDVAVRPWRHR